MPAFRDDDPSGIRLEFEAVPPGSPASVVVRQLVELLTAGELAPGSRLPPERALADSLGVGRSAVREALAALEILGIVQVRPGSGTYLRGGMSDLLPTTLSWGLMLAASRTRELVELRGSLEEQAAELAAQRAPDESLDALDRYVAAMAAAVEDLPAFVEADASFHVLLASATGNEVLADLLQSVRSLLRVWVERGLRTREQAEAAVAQHRAVLAAVRRHDAPAARAAMAAHMATASERVLSADAADAAPPAGIDAAETEATTEADTEAAPASTSRGSA